MTPSNGTVSALAHNERMGLPSLKILHVMRSPVGGLFRHVVDLAGEQAARGHQVGVVADSNTGGARAEAMLGALAPQLALGIERFPMSRHPGPADWAASRRVAAAIARHGADVAHGHGAKGGAYARLASTPGLTRVYTPHGGSLHYSPTSPLGMLYLGLERLLMRRTELFLFESAYGRDRFLAAVGTPKSTVRVVHNGVAAAEFDPVAPSETATDFLFIGEMRTLKGVDVLLDALAILCRTGRAATATLVGDGPDAAAFRERAASLDLGAAVNFRGAMPAREAFALGRCLVVPSRAESLPYIVLEALAAGMPTIATNVGGIPEIFAGDGANLIPAGDPAALAEAMRRTLEQGNVTLILSQRLQANVRAGFSVAAMCDQVLGAYQAARS